MFVFSTGPIDWWQGWQRPEALFRICFCHDHSGFDCPYLNPADWASAWERARRLARRLGWEGDIACGPSVSVLPPADCGESSLVLIAWKQANNGTSFVASPVWLPHLVSSGDRNWVGDGKDLRLLQR